MGLSNIVPNSRLAQPGVCTSTTRPATPYEGQVIYETDTNRVLVWDASAWVMIADTDAPPALQLVKSQTVGTAVSSVTVSDAFSSEWDNYRIVMRYVVSSAANPGLYVTLGSQATAYYGATAYWSYDASGDGVAKRNNGTEWNWGYFGANNTSGAWDLINPNNATRTSYVGGFAGDLYHGSTSGMLGVNTQFTSITFAPSTGTITGGTIRVYGYRN